MLGVSAWALGAALLLTGCGGSSKPAEAASDEPSKDTPAEPPSLSEEGAAAETGDEQPAASAEGEQQPATNPGESEPEPQFTDSMSVEQAIAAVPRGVERRNIDAETLAKPLLNLELYDSCKPGGAKVKLRVAVWNGKAVGVDVSSTPKNPKLADCIQAKVRALSWEKQVPSLNTVEYQF